MWCKIGKNSKFKQKFRDRNVEGYLRRTMHNGIQLRDVENGRSISLLQKGTNYYGVSKLGMVGLPG